MDSRTLYCGTPEKWFGADIQQNDSDFAISGENQSYKPKIGDTDQKSEIQSYCIGQEEVVINFEHINFLKVGTTRRLTRGKSLYFLCFRGEYINFLARLTLGQPAVCPRAIWTLTRAKSLCLCAFFSPGIQAKNHPEIRAESPEKVPQQAFGLSTERALKPLGIQLMNTAFSRRRHCSSNPCPPKNPSI